MTSSPHPHAPGPSGSVGSDRARRVRCLCWRFVLLAMHGHVNDGHTQYKITMRPWPHVRTVHSDHLFRCGTRTATASLLSCQAPKRWCVGSGVPPSGRSWPLFSKPCNRQCYATSASQLYTTEKIPCNHFNDLLL